MFIFLLGYDVDFGHMEAVNLLSSLKISEKQCVRILHKHIHVKLIYCGVVMDVGISVCLCADE